MALGSLTGALGLFLIASAAHPIAYYAVWMVLGVAMAANLYDAAFSIAWPHIRRRRAPANHRADPCRWVRLHGQLADDAFLARARGLSPAPT